MVCSRVVLALTALTAPLNYYGDYRPFFTIYDPDCATFARKPPGKPSKGGDKRVNIPAILGVTNPYFDQVGVLLLLSKYKRGTTPAPPFLTSTKIDLTTLFPPFYSTLLKGIRPLADSRAHL